MAVHALRLTAAVFAAGALLTIAASPAAALLSASYSVGAHHSGSPVDMMAWGGWDSGAVAVDENGATVSDSPDAFSALHAAQAYAGLAAAQYQGGDAYANADVTAGDASASVATRPVHPDPEYSVITEPTLP